MHIMLKHNIHKSMGHYIEFKQDFESFFEKKIRTKQNVHISHCNLHCSHHGLCSLLPAYVIYADISNLKATTETDKCFFPESTKCFEAELMQEKAY